LQVSELHESIGTCRKQTIFDYRRWDHYGFIIVVIWLQSSRWGDAATESANAVRAEVSFAGPLLTDFKQEWWCIDAVSCVADVQGLRVGRLSLMSSIGWWVALYPVYHSDTHQFFFTSRCETPAWSSGTRYGNFARELICLPGATVQKRMSISLQCVASFVEKFSQYSVFPCGSTRRYIVFRVCRVTGFWTVQGISLELGTGDKLLYRYTL